MPRWPGASLPWPMPVAKTVNARQRPSYGLEIAPVGRAGTAHTGRRWVLAQVKRWVPLGTGPLRRTRVGHGLEGRLVGLMERAARRDPDRIDAEILQVGEVSPVLTARAARGRTRQRVHPRGEEAHAANPAISRKSRHFRPLSVITPQTRGSFRRIRTRWARKSLGGAGSGRLLNAPLRHAKIGYQAQGRLDFRLAS